MIDVDAAFLNADLKELLYVKWVEGMVELGYLTLEQALEWCAQCLKVMYGGVQLPRAWFLTFTQTLLELGYLQSQADSCVIFGYTNSGDLKLIIIIYVDDTLLIGTGQSIS